MFSGYMGKMLHVNLSTGEMKDEDITEELAYEFIGGNGFAARILFEQQGKGIDPLGPENILAFVTGPLTGTPALFGTRHSIVTKSPMTGGWGESNSGGLFGPYLRFSGYDAVFFRGISEKPVYLYIENGKPEIRDAVHLWGKDTYQTMDLLRSETSQDVKTASIGPSGEKLSLIAGVVNDRTRTAARSGVGAVMGSKKLKAIAVNGSLKVPIAHPNKLKELRKKFMGQISGWLKDSLQKYGTSGGTVRMVALGIAPVKNWDGTADDFPEIERLNPDNMLNVLNKKHACYKCPIFCGGTLHAGKEYKYEHDTPRPEYETMNSFGALCLNSNLESIIMMNDICNRYGIDTISTGTTLAFALECYEKGLINKQDTEGIELTWGNHSALVELTEKMAKREGFGALLADGAKVAAEKIDKGAEVYAMHVHGRELPAADLRSAPSLGVTYVTGANTADHTSGGAEWAEMGRGVPEDVECPSLDRLAFTGKAKVHALIRKIFHIIDASGFCVTARNTVPMAALTEQLAAVTGWNRSLEELLVVGERISCLCQAFNVREGLNLTNVKIPERAAGRPAQKKGLNANVSVPVEEMAREFYEVMEWDVVTGKPSQKKLLELGLDYAMNELWA